jgi:hypothetical protein
MTNEWKILLEPVCTQIKTGKIPSDLRSSLSTLSMPMMIYFFALCALLGLAAGQITILPATFEVVMATCALLLPFVFERALPVAVAWLCLVSPFAISCFSQLYLVCAFDISGNPVGIL